MASQSERSEQTRARLIDAAEARFVEAGYEATSLESILTLADVSKGALYHHFPGKEDLFAAVFDRVSRQAVGRAVKRAGKGRSARDGLIETAIAWLREAEQAPTRTILLEIGPRALGWARARAIEEANTHGLVRAAIEAAVHSGEARCADPDLAARLINAMLTELALARSTQTGGRPSLQSTRKAVEAVIGGLLT